MDDIDPQDRRKIQRFPQRNVFGTISHAKRRSRISCLVRDLSRSGARLWTLAVRIIPDNFLLTLDDTSESADCTVVWRTETEIGVVFDREAPL